MKPLDSEDLYKRKIVFKKLEAGLTGTTIEQSESGMKNNSDFSVFYEVENTDVDLTTYASKNNEEYDNMKISVK